MGLKLLTEISLPPHKSKGGFDHAAYLSSQGLLYVAHTANDCVDIINCAQDRYLESIGNLKSVAAFLLTLVSQHSLSQSHHFVHL